MAWSKRFLVLFSAAILIAIGAAFCWLELVGCDRARSMPPARPAA